MKEEQLITLQQPPIIIYERIKAVGQQIEAKIAELNLDNQLVTEDTKQALKNTRAELNKEFATFEQQRKLIKEMVNAPYEAFEKAYKDNIKVHYEQADSTLKSKLTEFDNRLRQDKEDRARAYFIEACQANNIDFLPFEKLYLKININTSDKSLRESIDSTIERVVKDLETANFIPESDEFKAEVLTEYKQTLDVSAALRNAQYRKQQREAELQRIEEQKKRAEQARLEAEARAQEQAPLQAPAQVQPAQEASQAPLQEEILQYTLTVQGTRAQLKALRVFLETNNIKYTAE